MVGKFNSMNDNVVHFMLSAFSVQKMVHKVNFLSYVLHIYPVIQIQEKFTNQMSFKQLPDFFLKGHNKKLLFWKNDY